MNIKYYAVTSLPNTPNNAGEIYFTIDGSQYISTTTSFVKISDLLFVDNLPQFGQLQKLYLHDSKLKIWNGIEYKEVGGGQEFDATQLEADITHLQSDISILQGKVSTVESKITTNEGKISALEAKVAVLETHEGTLVSDESGAHGLKVTKHKIMFQEKKNGEWIEFDTASSVLPSVTGFKGISESDGSSITVSWVNPVNEEYIKTEVFASKIDISHLDISELDGIATKIVDDNSTSQFVQNTTYGDTYYFKVYTSHNFMGTTKYANAQTITVRAVDSIPPSIVTNIKVIPANERLTLTWINPTDADLAKVKVVMKEGGYPMSHTDGTVIYEGTGNSVNVNQLSNGKEYFIRFFTIDIVGNINSSSEMQASTIPYKLQDISALNISSNLAGTEFTLDWTNPIVTTFDSVEAYVATSDLSLKTREQCVIDGQLIYDGDSNTINHVTIPNNTYYFKIFTKHIVNETYVFSDGLSGNKKAEDKESPSIVTNVEIKSIDGGLEVKWTNPIETDLANVRLHYSLSDSINTINDGIVAYNGSGNSVTINGLENDTEYHLRFFTVDVNGNVNNDLIMKYKGIPKAPTLKYYDTLTTIGANETITGAAYNNAGFFGEVSSSELFTASELSLETGISQGKVESGNVTWLKFYIDGKILFTPKTNLRSNISWDDINNAGCVFGDCIVDKNGTKFKVRLFKGALTNPSLDGDSDKGAKQSEWNRLMLPSIIYSENKDWEFLEYVDDDLPSWHTNYPVDIQFVNGSYYSYTWCQESLTSNSNSRVQRGGSYSVEFSASENKSNRYMYWSWRPVLEVVPPEELEGGN